MLTILIYENTHTSHKEHGQVSRLVRLKTKVQKAEHINSEIKMQTQNLNG
jgi:hypothetical protein